MQEQLFDLELSYEKLENAVTSAKTQSGAGVWTVCFREAESIFIKLGFGLDMNEEQLNRLCRIMGGLCVIVAKDVL